MPFFIVLTACWGLRADKHLLSMKEKLKKEYDTPMVELIEARVEKGFQMSGAAADPQTTGANEALTAGSDSYSGSDFD